MLLPKAISRTKDLEKQQFIISLYETKVKNEFLFSTLMNATM